MAINKVNYNGRTLIDLTEDTVTSETLLSGQTAHDRSGQAIIGSLSMDPIQSGLAIIVNGDTASMAVPVGGYAYIKNNTHGLTEGLYSNTSSSAFPASGGTADSTVFTAVDDGGLNDIRQQGKALADNLGALSSAMTYVVSGNKSVETVTIPVGAYVRLVGSTIAGRSDGIYTVATAIPVDMVVDGTYFNESAPILGGVANALNASLKIITYNVAQTSSIKEVDLTLSGYTPVMMSLATWLGYKGFMRCDDHFPNKIYIFTDGYSSGTINHKLMVLYQKN